MTAVLITTTMHAASGLPRDDMQNSFVFEASNLGNAIAIGVPAVKDFYMGTGAVSARKVGSYIGPQISRTATCDVKTYDITSTLDGSPHGSPVDVDSFTMPASFVATILPEEIAACLSFHGSFAGLLEKATTTSAIPTDERAIEEGAPATHLGFAHPKERVRGRVFIGPLNYNAVTGSTRAALDTTFKLCLVEAGQRLLGLVGANWRVWSRRNATVVTVTGGFVDDAFDTQRRRGEKALARSIF